MLTVIIMLLEAPHRYPHEMHFLKPEESVGIRHRKVEAFGCEPMSAASEKRWRGKRSGLTARSKPPERV